MSDAPGLTVEHVRGTVTVVAVTGELDHHSSPGLRSGVLELVRGGHPHVVLDVSGVAFCDSSGLSALINLWHNARADGGSLVLCSVPGRLDRLLRMTGLDQILARASTVEEALAGHPALRDADGPG
ncbi:STAS domain-containing protein [Streptomyces sp. DH37]|uniref:STAS domain-containing protein n=1 Tax=Streptomyces sp. DH37 TaxID=3040122 RepID=UPI0024434757|nr:STAS domain-containing protein [Streptomyces sp. DH37]MDG9704655.1 STAS domain-containing protein [Streptomyces sp. DH37]